MYAGQALTFHAHLHSMDQVKAAELARWLFSATAEAREVKTPNGTRRFEIWDTREIGSRSVCILLGAGLSWRGAFLSLVCRCETAALDGFRADAADRRAQPG